MTNGGSRARKAAAALLLAFAAAATGCASEHSPDSALEDCERSDSDERSVARVWDEATLSLVRQVIPAPTEHARNLFHVSAAMWDAWAAYDEVAVGYFVTEKHDDDDVMAARETAMSYAAYRILLWRYGTISDLTTAAAELDEVLTSLCYDHEYDSSDGSAPADLGNRIAETILAESGGDGSLEEERYVDSTYRPSNPPMVVADPGTTLSDPNAWQPLSLGTQIAQNGLPIPGSQQEFLGPHWGHVTPFALELSQDGLPIDPGPPPRLDDPESDTAYKADAVEVIRYSSWLDPADGVEIDVGPASMGDNTLGENDGDGYDLNPATGEPYERAMSLRADFDRVIAEYWADGPDSETPPGHWNVIANTVADSPEFERRIGGAGPELDPLEWDVKTYFALNGAEHDAAIAAWGTKRYYDSVRPISMIRYLGGNGQSSDPDGPAYDPHGLPLDPGLVELITAESSAPGERHAHLSEHLGEIAIWAWLGSPDDPVVEMSGVGWMRAVEWVPYQRPTFVSPAFASYVSGHSAFSRAGAEVMTALTGDSYFPGGLMEWTVRAGDLIHEEGPTRDVTLQWATYFDAADQAGISRLHGGIHITPDDVEGRRVGAEAGAGAWQLAQSHFDGSGQS